MSAKFEVRQLVKRANRNTIEPVFTSEFERGAIVAFHHFCETCPADYFEVVRVENNEDCLMHNANRT